MKTNPVRFLKKKSGKKSPYRPLLAWLAALVLSILTLPSCEKLGICVDRKLQVEQQNYNGTRLRTDGYYSCPVDTDANGLELNEIIIFYRNGVALFPGDVSTGSEELYLHSISGSPNLHRSKPAWGTFSIQDSFISISKWKSSQCGYPAILRTGQVMNDTTFVINSMDIKGKYGTGNLPKEQYYHYHTYFPKPDSVNDFITGP